MRWTDRTISWIVPTVILAVAAFLRFNNYYGWSFSNDELSALARLQFSNFSALIREGVIPDFHPAGVQIFLYLWTKLFGTSEMAVRLPFVLTGILSVWIFLKLASRWINPQAGWMAGALFASLQFQVLYSQLARPYSIGLMFVLLAAYFFSKLFLNRPSGGTGGALKIQTLSGFTMAVIGAMYSHYFSMLQAGLICLSGLFYVQRTEILKYIFSVGIAVLAYVPHLPVFFAQVRRGGIGGTDGWLGPPDKDFLIRFMEQAFNQSTFLLGAVIMMFLVPLLFSTKRFSNLKNKIILLIWFFIPYLIAYYYSQFINPVLQPSTLLFSFPFLLVFVFSFLSPVKPAWIAGIFALAFLTMGTFSTVFSNRFYKTEHFAVFRPLSEKSIEFSNRYGCYNITRTANLHNPYYILHYLNDTCNRNFDLFKCNDYQALPRMIEIVMQASTPYFQHLWSNIFDLPETEAVIRSKYPFLIHREKHFHSEISLFASSPQTGKINPFIFSASQSFEKPSSINEFISFDSTQSHSGKYSVLMDSLHTFSPAFSFHVSEMNLDSTKTYNVFASAWVYPLQKEELKSKLVISFENESGMIQWYGCPLKYFLPSPGQWTQVFAALRTNYKFSGREVFKSYIVNDDSENFLMDDHEIKAAVY